MDDTDPLGVFLVKSGSKGDRLLFRYPYSQNGNSDSEKLNKKIPHAAVTQKREELYSPKKAKSPQWDEIGLFNFNDKVLSNLFAVKPELCGQQFELKIENVRFVGHPTYLPHETNRESSTLTMFHVVFALQASASHSVVNSYHDLSHRLSMAIKNEERRCGYLTCQVKLMQIAIDEIASLPEDCEESPFNLILQRSQLAIDLRIMYEDLRNTGIVRLRMNEWIEVSFCLPSKVHYLRDDKLNFGPESIQSCLKALRPYHGILLLVDVNELLISLPEDTLPALVRLIKMWNPLKNLQHLAADADIILSNVFQIVGHLVYWCKAMIIYPLCDSNVYSISSHAPTYIHSQLAEQFETTFGTNMLSIMNKFSLPTSLSDLADPLGQPYEQPQLVQMVVWLLQRRLLIQLHTYISLLPAEYRSRSLRLAGRKRQEEEEELPKRYESTSNLHSYQSEESLLSSKSSSDDDLSLQEQVYAHFSELTPSQRNSILKESSAGTEEDWKNFLRLCPYFNGKYHLEEIMYSENVRRSQLLALLDKFRKILITYQCEDAAVVAFYNYL